MPLVSVSVFVHSHLVLFNVVIGNAVDSLADGRDDESFLFLDPRAPSATNPPAGTKYADVIVFVVGGGSYSEYFNLQVQYLTYCDVWGLVIWDNRNC